MFINQHIFQGFDAVDDMYIAKILVEAGTEVKVGDPVMISVEESEYVDNFGDYTLPATAKTDVSTPASTTAEQIPAEKITAPTATPASEKTPKAASPPPPPPVAAAPPPPVTAPPAPPVVPRSEIDTMWGKYVSRSPLVTKISKDQVAYIAKYGQSCHSAVHTKQTK